MFNEPFFAAVPTTPGPEQLPAAKNPDDFIGRSDQIVRKVGREMGVPRWGMYAIVVGKLTSFFIHTQEWQFTYTIYTHGNYVL